MEALAEIPEADATGALGALYADIRQTAGTAMVNLIYRHIATIPDALPWVWQTIRDSIGYDAIRGAADALPEVGLGEPLPAAAYAMLGMDTAAVADAVRIVESYNRANALNLVTLTALARILEASPDGPPAQRVSPPASRSSAGAALPPIIPLSAMDQDTRALVMRLASVGAEGPDAGSVIPSLYRHLAHWPAYLALALAVLVPLDAAGAVAQGRSRMIAAARDGSAALAEAGLSRGISAPPPDAAGPLAVALARFTGGVIPTMLPVGHTLRRLAPASLRPPHGDAPG